MMNSVIALKCLGYPEDHALMKDGIHELDLLEIYDEAEHLVGNVELEE